MFLLSVNFTGQLNCGARAFDYRPYYEDGVLYAHHGTFVVKKPMVDVLNEVVYWCNAHPSELVIFDVNSCDGDVGCYDASISLVQSLGLYSVTDCSILDSLTFAGAKSDGLLPNGGSLVIVFDCLEMLYDDKINCYGKDFYCYDDKTKSIPFGQMSEYLHNCTVNVPVNDGRLWSPQVYHFKSFHDIFQIKL